MPGASISRNTAGNGPPRSGWQMNVSIAPSLVAMSSVCSIIGGVPPWLCRAWSDRARLARRQPGRKTMPTIEPTGAVLGATVHGIDLSRDLDARTVGQILRGLGDHGVLRFPDQHLDMNQLRRFSERFGEIQGPSAGTPDVAKPNYAAVGILSNIKENGAYIGLPDAGQDWHTDMSYRDVMGFVNVLYGIRIPHRDGKPLGGTEFSNMHLAYDALPEDLKTRLANATATHDFEKFWEHMRRDKASTRPPMTDEQRRRRPPVTHPLFRQLYT